MNDILLEQEKFIENNSKQNEIILSILKKYYDFTVRHQKVDYITSTLKILYTLSQTGEQDIYKEIDSKIQFLQSEIKSIAYEK